jgi:hypothetical protein
MLATVHLAWKEVCDRRRSFLVIFLALTEQRRNKRLDVSHGFDT